MVRRRPRQVPQTALGSRPESPQSHRGRNDQGQEGSALRIVLNLTESEVSRLKKLKQRERQGKDSWEDWLRSKIRYIGLRDKVTDLIGQGTGEHLAELWMENLAENIETFKLGTGKNREKGEGGECKDTATSIGVLPKKDGPAIIVGASPHIREFGHLGQLAGSSYRGAVFCTDRMLGEALEKGVTPDRFPNFYVASVDGNRELIPEFYDQPIIKEWAPRIEGLFATTIATKAVEKWGSMGGRFHWFHGMMDNFQSPESLTRFMNFMTGHTSLQCAGNTGAVSIMLAWYIGYNPICLIGMGYGYMPDTPIEDTAYYKTLMEAHGGDLDKTLQFYRQIYNPDLDVECTTDMVFLHYKDGILDMIPRMRPTRVLNCTNGGIIFGKGVKTMKFADFLEESG